MGAKVACTVVTLLVVGGVWGVYFLLRAITESTTRCPVTPTCTDGTLPGGEADPRFSHSAHYLGGRTCAWFRENATRCALPVAGNFLCFDRVAFRDPSGRNCEWWTQYVLGNPAVLHSSRHAGDETKCNTPPPSAPGNRSMTPADLLEMKDACCVCGANRALRNYAGPTSAAPKTTGDALPGKPALPTQHKNAKVATHMTQCCSCGLALKRGGNLKCPTTELVDWDRQTKLLTPYLIAGLILSAVLALAWILALACCRKTEGDGQGSREEGQGSGVASRMGLDSVSTPLMLRL